MFLPDSKTVLLQGKARYNEEFDELKNQLNCKLNFLKYFSLISMIKSKNVTNITNAEYRSH
jgi:hypothetical protein